MWQRLADCWTLKSLQDLLKSIYEGHQQLEPRERNQVLAEKGATFIIIFKYFQEKRNLK